VAELRKGAGEVPSGNKDRNRPEKERQAKKKKKSIVSEARESLKGKTVVGDLMLKEHRGGDHKGRKIKLETLKVRGDTTGLTCGENKMLGSQKVRVTNSLKVRGKKNKHSSQAKKQQKKEGGKIKKKKKKKKPLNGPQDRSREDHRD